jgi:hypothetical protein
VSRISVGIVAALGLVGLIVVVSAATQILLAQRLAPAASAVAPAPLPAGGGVAPAAVALTPNALLLGTMLRSVMPAIISVVLLIPSAIVALSRDRGPEHQRWATAALSSILTYWLS